MNTAPCQSISSQTEKWFDDLVSQLRSDQIQLDASVASKEKQSFYKMMMSANQDDIFMFGRQTSSRYFIEHMLVEYLNELNSLNCSPRKLAFHHSNSKILVWAEIEDNDDHTEDQLLIAESKINAKYHCNGFHISSTILENCDSFTIPPHYQPFLTS